MPFLIGATRFHVDGHKELTEKEELIELELDQYEVSMTVGSHNAKVLVKVGDKVKKGDLLGKRDDHFYVPIFSPCSGEVIDICQKTTTRGTLGDYVIIKNDHEKNETLFDKVDLNNSKEEIINFMKTIGLLGQGGAGFPTYIKYQTDACETLIINAVECEPYITSDMVHIEKYTDLFMKGVLMMFKASNAKKCYIAIKKNHHEIIAKLKDAFKDHNEIEIKEVEDVYPMGWERTLVYELLAKRYDKLPIEVNAIVSNATSALSLGFASTYGKPMTKRVVTVSGNAINKPSNFYIHIGTPIKELINKCEGVNSDDINLVLGGPMMGISIPSDEISITTINNAVTVFNNRKDEEYECLKCGSCIEHCPSSLQPALIRRYYLANKKDKIEKLKVNDCIECGLCAYMCPSKIPLTAIMAKAKELLKGDK